MKTRPIIFAGCVALILLLIPLLPYKYFFNGPIEPCHEVWGQFGDFFGGILNPLYALLAFFGVLYSIAQQRQEFEKTSLATQNQIRHIETSTLKEDYFRIIKSIDDELRDLLDVVVSPENVQPRLCLKHIAHEAYRLRQFPVKEGSYADFLRLSKSSGAVVESVYEQARAAIAALYTYVSLYESIGEQSTGQIAAYFAQKHKNLIQIVQDNGDLTEDMRAFFLRHR